jgi:GH25 family lysozyme M1 (1,4-beta-N-acetylmuramidase)
VNPDSKNLIALDIESTKDISLENARKFSLRIKEKTGRWPVLYANNQVVKEISEKYRNDSVFRNMPLWYARFKTVVTDFPRTVWPTYAIWQFSCEINCPKKDKSGCLYNVPGTQNDMDINVYNGTTEQLLKKWPL